MSKNEDLQKENEHALNYIERVLKADTRPSKEINFAKLQKLLIKEFKIPRHKLD